MLINLLAIANINCAPYISLETGVENSSRVIQCRAFGKRKFHDFLVTFAGTNDPIMLQHRYATPFPCLNHTRVGSFHNRPNPGKHVSPPMTKLIDFTVNQLGRRSYILFVVCNIQIYACNF